MSKSKTAFYPTTTVTKALRMGPRKFAKDYLFPAMRREHGNGFAMDVWHRDTDQQTPIGLDGIYTREYPACHSIMCIGGTMQAITGSQSEKTLARILGLPHRAVDGVNDANTLFYDWKKNVGPWAGLSGKFEAAETPREKERVAEKAVLKAIKIGEAARA